MREEGAPGTTLTSSAVTPAVLQTVAEFLARYAAEPLPFALASVRAAKAGDYDSASCLATFYLTGTGGVTKNELAAVYWSRCAAEGGVHNNRIYSIIYSCEEAPGPLRQWALVMLAVKGVDEFRVQLEMETMKESVVRVNAEWLPTPEEVAADAAARQEIAERAAGAAAGVAGVTGAAAAAS